MGAEQRGEARRPLLSSANLGANLGGNKGGWPVAPGSTVVQGHPGDECFVRATQRPQKRGLLVLGSQRVLLLDPGRKLRKMSSCAW